MCFEGRGEVRLSELQEVLCGLNEPGIGCSDILGRARVVFAVDVNADEAGLVALNGAADGAEMIDVLKNAGRIDHCHKTVRLVRAGDAEGVDLAQLE